MKSITEPTATTNTMIVSLLFEIILLFAAHSVICFRHFLACFLSQFFFQRLGQFLKLFIRYLNLRSLGFCHFKCLKSLKSFILNFFISLNSLKSFILSCLIFFALLQGLVLAVFNSKFGKLYCMFLWFTCFFSHFPVVAQVFLFLLMCFVSHSALCFCCVLLFFAASFALSNSENNVLDFFSMTFVAFFYA